MAACGRGLLYLYLHLDLELDLKKRKLLLSLLLTSYATFLWMLFKAIRRQHGALPSSTRLVLFFAVLLLAALLRVAPHDGSRCIVCGSCLEQHRRGTELCRECILVLCDEVQCVLAHLDRHPGTNNVFRVVRGGAGLEPLFYLVATIVEKYLPHLFATKCAAQESRPSSVPLPSLQEEEIFIYSGKILKGTAFCHADELHSTFGGRRRRSRVRL